MESFPHKFFEATSVAPDVAPEEASSEATTIDSDKETLEQHSEDIEVSGLAPEDFLRTAALRQKIEDATARMSPDEVGEFYLRLNEKAAELADNLGTETMEKVFLYHLLVGSTVDASIAGEIERYDLDDDFSIEAWLMGKVDGSVS